MDRARSRLRWSIWSLVRIAQTCFCRSGGLAPISFPLFQGVRPGAGSKKLALSIVLFSQRRAPHSPDTDAFEEEAHGRPDALLPGFSRPRVAHCLTPRGASENQIEKHARRELGVTYDDLLLLDIVREHARNPLYGRKPACRRR